MVKVGRRVPLQAGLLPFSLVPGQPADQIDGPLTDLLVVPAFAQRLAERDVAARTSRRLSLNVTASTTVVMAISFLSLSKPSGVVTAGAVTGVLAIALLAGVIAGVCVWADLSRARASAGTSRFRFIATYTVGGAFVGGVASAVLPLTGFTSATPAVVRIVSDAIIAPWLAVVIGLLIDGRNRLQAARSLVIEQAANVSLKASSEAALIEDLRSSLARDVEEELRPALETLDERLAYEQQFAQTRVSSALAEVLRDLNESSVRPLSRLIADRSRDARKGLGPVDFLAGVARTQPFRPVAVSGIFVLTAVADQWTASGPAEALATAASGVLLITLILGSGNRLMRAFPRRHLGIFLATFVVLQIPTYGWEFATGSSLTPGFLAHLAVGVFLSACIIWLTSGLGEWRAPQVALLRVYAAEIDSARIEVLTQTEVVSSIAKSAARMLHGSVQSKLAACALAIDRAAMTDDAAVYEAAINQARAVLATPLAWINDPRDPETLSAEINKKVDLWQGLAGITAFVAPALKQYTGEKVDVVGEVVEEGLCNAIRHGGASTIAVQVDLDGDGPDLLIRVRVLDDGCGPPQDPRPGLGSALLDDACEGRWELVPAPSGGCLLDAWVVTQKSASA